MASTPRFKVYDAHGQYQAATKEVEAAAALMGFYGAGATIKLDHKLVVWREGNEQIPASESYDRVSEVAWSHIHAKQCKLRRMPIPGSLPHRD